MNIMDYIKKHEGFRDTIYQDTKGHKTIGYGFNLDNPAIAALIAPDVRIGRRKMTKDEAERVFNYALKIAEKDAKSVIGEDSYAKLSPQQQMVITDMAYNLGRTKLKGFEEMIKAIKKGDYRKAAYEMRNSDWYHQVGNRAIEDINLFLGGNKASNTSFKDAFRKAREKGLKTFIWKGKKYTTKLRGEE